MWSSLKSSGKTPSVTGGSNGTGGVDTHPDTKFPDDAYISLHSSIRNPYYDRPSWFRTLVSKGRYRNVDDGYINLKSQFEHAKLTKKLSLSSIPFQTRIYRLSCDSHLSHTVAANDRYEQAWFQLLLRPQSLNKAGQVEWHFHPVDFNQNIRNILGSLSAPIVDDKCSSLLSFTIPKALASYIALAFLHPEFICPRTGVGAQAYAFPYIIELEPFWCYEIKSHILDVRGGQESNIKYWYQQNGEAMVHRFLVWRSQDNTFWSKPIDMVDPNDNVASLASALKATWTTPTLIRWIEQNLEPSHSFGFALWHERHSRLQLNYYAEYPENLMCDATTDVIFVPMANYNNDRLLAFQRQRNYNVDHLCSSHMVPSQENQRWQDCVNKFTTPTQSLAFMYSGAVQALASNAPHVSITQRHKMSQTADLAPPFCICPEDFHRFVPIPPSGSYIDSRSFGWRSKSCKIIACGLLSFCLDMMVQIKANDDKQNVVCKVMDISSLPDQFAIIGSNSILQSKREQLVDLAVTKFRREIWWQAVIPPNRHIARYRGWSMFGPIMAIVMDKYKATFGVLLACIESYCQNTVGSQAITHDSTLFFMSASSKYQAHNPRIHRLSYHTSNLSNIKDWLESNLLSIPEDERNANTLSDTTTVKVVSKLMECFKQICVGAAHLHANAVVHRDLKPSNIMIDENGGIRIIDFESCVNMSQYLFQLVSGTPRYMPVNFVSDSSDRYYTYDDGSVDVFSIIEMMLKSLKRFKGHIIPDKFFKLLDHQKKYLTDQVLISHSLSDQETAKILVQNRKHEPYVVNDQFVMSRNFVLVKCYTATKLADLIQKYIDKMNLDEEEEVEEVDEYEEDAKV